MKLTDTCRPAKVIGVCLIVAGMCCSVPDTKATPFGVAQVPRSSHDAPDGVKFIEYKTASGGNSHRDWQFGFYFETPARWSIEKSGRWFDRGFDGDAYQATTILMHHKGSDIQYKLYYRIFNDVTPQTPAEIDRILRANVEKKVRQRKDSNGLKDYRVRPDSYEVRDIGGQRALGYVADYTQYKKKMVEYLVSVQDARSVAQFFVQVPADQLDEVRENAEPIVESIKIP